MKRAVVLAVVMALWAYPVYANVGGDPVPPTPTPVVCPTGDPTGNIDPVYVEQCGECVPVQPTLTIGGYYVGITPFSVTQQVPGTSVPGGTVTPTAALTPIPPATPTPIGTTNPEYFWFEFGGSQQVNFTGTQAATVDMPDSTYLPIANRVIIVRGNLSDGQLYLRVVENGYSLFFLDPTVSWNGLLQTSSNNGVIDPTEIEPGWTFGTWGQYQWNYAELGGDGIVYLQMNQPAQNSVSVTVEIYYVYSSLDVPEPSQGTPTPTLEPGFDCSEYQYSDQAIGLDISMVTRDGGCFTLIPDVGVTVPSIPLLFPSGIDFSTVGVQLCVTYVTLPRLELLGYTVPVDVMVSLSLALWYLRRLIG